MPGVKRGFFQDVRGARDGAVVRDVRSGHKVLTYYWRMTGSRTAAMLALTCVSCATPVTPTAPTAAETVRFPDLKAMAGTYTLTVDLDESCTAMPAAARRRTYRATLDDRGWHYLVVSIAGGGFPEPTVVADLFSGQLSPLQRYDPRLKWNNFDLFCDVKEPLGGGAEFAVCGEGPVAQSELALAGAVTGYAFISRGGAVVARCEGVHHFSFERRGTRWPSVTR